ncbi:MAG TPA: protein-glutamate O-methyltransferase CheR [Burkholderiaceae bacterium]|nr:protein-glutamate O-methyltransferase CheR [Burkholderiaceae bacterium]HNB47624.1 protein-glutamate O-methyltransferase CheR [Burkholderiaceae bacterium]HNG82113.1 protein-glutamate O-methyltransferase CheR [Burkholderiaceae bacterium]
MSMSVASFEAVVTMFEKVSGIRLGAVKKPLVEGRLQRLAQQAGQPNLDRYVERLLHGNDPEELTKVIDKLTTNETYFFREPQHFDYLARSLRANPPRTLFRVWSAASSSGEEAYSIAMLLADVLGQRPWEVVGTDLSTAMVDSARRALYPMERARHTPPDYLKRFCLRGQGEYAGQLLVQRGLRERVSFRCANLMQPLPADLGMFDVIFLRNVLIYFDAPAKSRIVGRVIAQLHDHGHLFTGHAESLGNLDLKLRAVQPAVYVHV